MDCAAIMTKNPLTVREDETVGSAVEKLIAHRYTNLPVVDANGRYVGMFGIHDLLCLLVPRVALAGDLLPNLRFLGDDPGALRRRFADVKARRLGDAADRNAAMLAPDTSEVEAIRLFCQKHTSLAVTERGTGKVVGIVSYWDAIRAISGAPAGA
jgi:CBS domain-containing protein